MPKLIVLLIATILVSCSAKTEQDTCLHPTNEILTYTIVDTLVIDNSLNIAFNDFTGVKAEGNHLYISIQDCTQIYRVDLLSDSVYSIFNYDEINRPLIDFYFGQDLFLLTDYPYELLQFKRGEASPHVVFSSTETLHGYTSPFNGDKLHINEEKQTFQMYLFWEGKVVYDSALFSRSDLNGEIQNSFGELPLSYKNRNYPLLYNPSKIDVDSITLIGFGYEPHISKFNNITGAYLGNYCAASSFIETPIQGLPKSDEPDFQAESNHIITAPFYLGLYHDPYRHLYYRIVKHGQELKQSNHRLNARYDGEWSILVLSESLETIGEVKMPKDTFYYYSCFVGEKGLYVAFKKDVRKNAFALITINYDEK